MLAKICVLLALLLVALGFGDDGSDKGRDDRATIQSGGAGSPPPPCRSGTTC